MFEVNAFLAMFTLQIIVLSILHPLRIVKRIRGVHARYPAEQFPQLYPKGQAGVERSLNIYWLINLAVVVVGLALLGWLFRYTQRPDWDDGPAEGLVAFYFMLQLAPVMLCSWAAGMSNKWIRNTFPQDTRKATLQRRGLFDFVSPFVVLLAAACYLLFAAFAIYINRHPFPGYAGAYVNIGMVTALYAAIGTVIYKTLYGMKSNPLQTHADRMRMMEVVVKICVYSCMTSVFFLALNFTLVLLDMQRWEPLAQSVSCVTCALLYWAGLNAMPKAPVLQGLPASPAS